MTIGGLPTLPDEVFRNTQNERKRAGGLEKLARLARCLFLIKQLMILGSEAGDPIHTHTHTHTHTHAHSLVLGDLARWGLAVIGVRLCYRIQNMNLYQGAVFSRQNKDTIHILSDNPDTLGDSLSLRAK
jgi:hypothetical protein